MAPVMHTKSVLPNCTYFRIITFFVSYCFPLIWVYILQTYINDITSRKDKDSLTTLCPTSRMSDAQKQRKRLLPLYRWQDHSRRYVVCLLMFYYYYKKKSYLLYFKEYENVVRIKVNYSIFSKCNYMYIYI